jgi:hypothetical protein
MATKALSMTPADELEYQNELVRTANFVALGRMNKISIGPCQGYEPPPDDKYIKKYGRFIELRDKFLPIAQGPDRSIILVTAPMPVVNGRAMLPDLPDPSWAAEPWTEEESTGKAERPISKDKPRMIPQLLKDRTNEMLEGTQFYVFRPVVRLAFQPELNNRLIGDAWIINFKPNPANGSLCTLLVHRLTGECHFLGGLPDISGATGG